MTDETITRKLAESSAREPQLTLVTLNTQDSEGGMTTLTLSRGGAETTEQHVVAATWHAWIDETLDRMFNQSRTTNQKENS